MEAEKITRGITKAKVKKKKINIPLSINPLLPTNPDSAACKTKFNKFCSEHEHPYLQEALKAAHETC